MEASKNKKPDPAALGVYVRRLRLEAGLTVRGLARAAGVDATGISRLENGDNDAPTPQTLARLARVLECDVTDLYILAGYPTGQELPAFEPYLRARYGLSQEAIDRLGGIFDLVIEHEQREKGGRDDEDNDERVTDDATAA